MTETNNDSHQEELEARLLEALESGNFKEASPELFKRLREHARNADFTSQKTASVLQ